MSQITGVSSEMGSVNIIYKFVDFLCIYALHNNHHQLLKYKPQLE